MESEDLGQHLLGCDLGLPAIGLDRILEHFGDIRYTLETDRGDHLYVQSRGVRRGSAAVLARLGRGEEIDPSEYVFQTSTQIEAAAADLDWLNKGVFIGVGGRRPDGVIYETYLVE